MTQPARPVFPYDATAIEEMALKVAQSARRLAQEYDLDTYHALTCVEIAVNHINTMVQNSLTSMAIGLTPDEMMPTDEEAA